MPQENQVKVYRLFYPQVAVVIGSRKGDRVEAVALNSVISGSSDPPSVVWTMKREASILGIVGKSRAFSVNWLDSRHQESVDYLGFKQSRNPRDKIRAAGLTWLPGKKTLAPMVVEADAVLECDLNRIISFGDSELVVGNVVSTRTSPDFSEYWQFKTYKPLIYFGALSGLKKGRYVRNPSF
jgi:flavin reductase (DIM6/NTAB) family NADH-FMN oxidoreductase RutF